MFCGCFVGGTVCKINVTVCNIMIGCLGCCLRYRNERRKRVRIITVLHQKLRRSRKNTVQKDCIQHWYKVNNIIKCIFVCMGDLHQKTTESTRKCAQCLYIYSLLGTYHIANLRLSERSYCLRCMFFMLCGFLCFCVYMLGYQMCSIHWRKYAK